MKNINKSKFDWINEIWNNKYILKNKIDVENKLTPEQSRKLYDRQNKRDFRRLEKVRITKQRKMERDIIMFNKG